MNTLDRWLLEVQEYSKKNEKIDLKRVFEIFRLHQQREKLRRVLGE